MMFDLYELFDDLDIEQIDEVLALIENQRGRREYESYSDKYDAYNRAVFS